MSHHPPAMFLADSRGLDFLNSVATPVDTPVDWIADGEGLLDWLGQANYVPADVLKEIKAAYDKGPRVVLINQNVPGAFGNLMQVMSELTVGQLAPQQSADQLQQGVVEAAQAQGLPGW